MNHKTKSILYALLLCGTAASGQEQPSGVITLSIQEAIDTGLKNRYDLQSARYDGVLAHSEVQKSKKEWIPEISGSGNLRYSPQIQATYVPGGFFSEEPMLVALGANSMAIFGLELNQPLYKPGITTDVKLARSNAAIAEERIKESENTIKEQIIYAYLNVILKDLQRRIAASEENRYKEYNDLAEGKFKLGTMLETDFQKSKLDYENARVEASKANQNYELALVNIKYQINIPTETAIVLSDTIHSFNAGFDAASVEADAGNRTEIRQLKLQKQSHELEISKVRQNALPSVYAYGNFSRQFTYTNMDLTLSRWWSSFSYIGLSIKVPITSNFKNHNSIEESRAKARQVDLNLQQRMADVNYEIQKAQIELANAKQNMQVTKDNYDLSNEIYENQKKQYDLGARQYNDLLETNRSLNLAEQNYIKAVYDYLVANLNYHKAIGTY